jgi:hypothetical protein
MKWKRLIIITALLFLGIRIDSEQVPRGDQPRFELSVRGVQEKQDWIIGRFTIYPERDREYFDEIINK